MHVTNKLVVIYIQEYVLSSCQIGSKLFRKSVYSGTKCKRCPLGVVSPDRCQWWSRWTVPQRPGSSV